MRPLQRSRLFFMKEFRSFSLAHASNYKIGGPAEYFIEVESEREIREALAAYARRDIFILGAGTNVLVHDRGYQGVVLAPRLRKLNRRGNRVYAQAGVTMSALLEFCVTHSLAGLEWAGGLPGTVGGAVRGNAGCFGGEIKDGIECVESISLRTGKSVVRSRAQCAFGYRSSIFKTRASREVITGAWFSLVPGHAGALKKAIAEKVEYRRVRHPMEYPNIGSIFKNVPLPRFFKEFGVKKSEVVKTLPVKNDPFPIIPATYLLAHAQLQGTTKGGAMISPKHPNFIVNVRNAKSSDVEHLIHHARTQVKKVFNVTLEEEIQRLA